MKNRDARLNEMMHRLADEVTSTMEALAGTPKDELRLLLQRKWEQAYRQSDGDAIRFLDAACDELKMLILVSLMELEERSSAPDAA